MARIVSEQSGSDRTAVLDEVAAVLQNGGTAVIPTDTVYGIAQSVLSCPSGPAQLFAIKQRDPNKAIPWLVREAGDLDRYGMGITDAARRLAKKFWPGGLTLVVRASDEVPPAFRASDGTVALRMPDCTFVQDLIARLGSPLAATSANISGQAAPASFDEIDPHVLDAADIAVRGQATPDGSASTVVLCTDEPPVITRVGAIPFERICRVLI